MSGIEKIYINSDREEIHRMREALIKIRDYQVNASDKASAVVYSLSLIAKRALNDRL